MIARQIFNALLASFVLVTAVCGCSEAAPNADRIAAGDPMADAILRLQAWGGRGVHLARYTVHVPANANDATDSAGSGYPVAPPDLRKYDGYEFGKRTVILNGIDTVTDIEIVTHGHGGRSTDVSTYGNVLLMRDEIAPDDGG